MSDERVDTGTKDKDDPAGLSRRHAGISLLAVLGGALGATRTAQAFPVGSQATFIAASRLLRRYGVRVVGDEGAHDRLTFETAPLPMTEYSQSVGERNELGEILPCFKTSFLDGVEEFDLFAPDTSAVDPCFKTTRQDEIITSTHFHLDPAIGGMLPCVRTTIEGHSFATYELFDADDPGLSPCFKVESEMREGGELGAVDVTIGNPDVRVHVGDRTYHLVDGELVEIRTGV